MLPPPTPIVRYLLLINAVVFALVVLPGELGYPLGLADKLALYYWTSDNFHPYQLVTHFFMHADLGHVFFNMLVLYFFGPEIERRVGAKRFLGLYLGAAAGAVLLHNGQIWWQVNQSGAMLAAFDADPTLANFNRFFAGIDFSVYTAELANYFGDLQNRIVISDDPSKALAEARILMEKFLWRQEASRVVGASGAVSGVMAAFAVFYPWQKIFLLFVPIGIPAIFLIGGTFAADLFLGIMDYSFDSTARFAHIGGGIVGLVLALIWKKFVLPPWLKRMDK
ncbi:MAG: rhomboid family intramembrane serine protease [Bacteroidota bacterium]